MLDIDDDLVVFMKFANRGALPVDGKTGQIYNDLEHLHLEEGGFSPQQKFYYDEERILRTDTWEVVYSTPHAYYTLVVNFTPDDQLASVAHSSHFFTEFYVYDTSDWSAPIFTKNVHSTPGVIIDPNKDFVIAGRNPIRKYSLHDSSTLLELDVSVDDRGFRVNVSRRHLIRYNDDTYFFYDLDTLTLLHQTAEGFSSDMAISPRGDYYLLRSSEILSLYNADTHTAVSGFPSITDVDYFTYLGDSHYLLTYSRHFDDASRTYWGEFRIFDTNIWIEVENTIFDSVAICDAANVSDGEVHGMAVWYKNAPLKKVSGVIRDYNGNPCQRLVYLLDPDSDPPKVYTQTLSDPATGEYEMRFVNSANVVFVALADELVAGRPLPDIAYRLRQPQCLSG